MPSPARSVAPRLLVWLLASVLALLLDSLAHAGPPTPLPSSPIEPSEVLPQSRDVPDHDRRGMQLQAARIDGEAIRIDGRVDEREWQTVPLLPELIQQGPRFGRRTRTTGSTSRSSVTSTTAT
jgi:hypothetical protein